MNNCNSLPPLGTMNENYKLSTKELKNFMSVL